jgi:hypothetical protein
MKSRALQAAPAAVVLSAIVLAGVTYLLRAVEEPLPTAFDQSCELLDGKASTLLSDLLSQHDEAVDRQFNDWLFRLQRARRNCRFGWIDLARLDYQALLEKLHHLDLLASQSATGR